MLHAFPGLLSANTPLQVPQASWLLVSTQQQSGICRLFQTKRVALDKATMVARETAATLSMPAAMVQGSRR